VHIHGGRRGLIMKPSNAEQYFTAGCSSVAMYCVAHIIISLVTVANHDDTPSPILTILIALEL